MTAASNTPRTRVSKPKVESEDEIRARVEAEIRAEYESKLSQAEDEAKAERLKREALDTRPVSGFEISDDPTAAEAVTIHFVEDGFTILGKVWYRGEELTLVPGTDNWNDSKINGRPFAILDEDAQIERWGKRYFRPGRWRGLRLDQINDPEMSDEQRKQLLKAQRLSEERYGAVL